MTSLRNVATENATPQGDADVALVCLKIKFHKTLFTGYLVMANLWV